MQLPVIEGTTMDDAGPAWKPFVTEPLVVREASSSDDGAVMLIDPWTQRWAIVARPAVEAAKLADGTRTVADIAAQVGDAVLRHPDRIRGLLEHLRDSGLVYSSRSHHEHRGRPVYNATRIQGLHLEITNACNLSCTHCYVSSGATLPDELTTEELKSVIDQLEPFGDQVLYLTGGEAVVRKDCMEVVEYAVTERGLTVDLYSNAHKFPRKFAERLVAINEVGPGSVRLQVSIEGATAETNDAVRGAGCLEQIERSVAMFRELGLHRKLTSFACVTTANIAQVGEMIALAERWDVAELVFSQWQRQGNAADTPRESIAPSVEQWCAAGEMLLAYDNPGLEVLGNFFGDLNNDERGRYSRKADLFPKHIYASNAVPRVSPDGMICADRFWVTPDWSPGKVREVSLEQAFATAKFDGQLVAFEERPRAIEECASCPWVELCGSGSPGHTFAEYGDLGRKDLFCDSRQRWFQELVDEEFSLLPSPTL